MPWLSSIPVRPLSPLLALLAASALLAGCSSRAPHPTADPAPAGPAAPVAADPAPAPPGPPPAPERSPAERDLVLEIALAAPPAGASPGARIAIDLRWTVRNNSATRSHRVVQGGDGSESGWREPVLGLTAEVLAEDGTWEPMPRLPYGRCGLYDPNWFDEVVTLGPGESLELAWMPWTEAFFDLSTPRRVRFRAEYRFTGGEAGKGGPLGSATDPAGAPEPPIAPFTLVSEPLEVTIGG